MICHIFQRERHEPRLCLTGHKFLCREIFLFDKKVLEFEYLFVHIVAILAGGIVFDEALQQRNSLVGFCLVEFWLWSLLIIGKGLHIGSFFHVDAFWIGLTIFFQVARRCIEVVGLVGAHAKQKERLLAVFGAAHGG